MDQDSALFDGQNCGSRLLDATSFSNFKSLANNKAEKVNKQLVAMTKVFKQRFHRHKYREMQDRKKEKGKTEITGNFFATV